MAVLRLSIGIFEAVALLPPSLDGASAFFIADGETMKGKYDRDQSIELLKSKQSALYAEGTARYPKRSDFTNEEVVAIKAFLGPWPRALEAAGLKPLRDGGHAPRDSEKRIRAKKRRTAERRQHPAKIQAPDTKTKSAPAKGED